MFMVIDRITMIAWIKRSLFDCCVPVKGRLVRFKYSCYKVLWVGNISFPFLKGWSSIPCTKRDKKGTFPEHFENSDTCYHGCHVHTSGSFHSVRNLPQQKGILDRNHRKLPAGRTLWRTQFIIRRLWLTGLGQNARAISSKPCSQRLTHVARRHIKILGPRWI